jgi:dinuclear metal center YbgI/SA1388 family protein
VVERDALIAYLDELLDPASCADYCPNGLQVEGRPQVHRLISGVTASQALLDAAIAEQADAILVHHGYFWKGEDPRAVGMKGRRLAALLGAGVNLIAYHLPLDAHPQFGNNRQLGDRLGLVRTGEFDTATQPPLGWLGQPDAPLAPVALARRIEQALGRAPLHVEGGPALIRRVGWCTGAGQDFIEAAARAGADAFISGEISERTTHSARELGVHYFAAGHHASERYGVQALAEHVAQHFGLEHRFIDIDNPA